MKRILLAAFVVACVAAVLALLFWPADRSEPLVASRQVVGDVVDSAGQPVADALVSAGGVEARSDAKGHFALVGVDGERVPVRVRAAGFVDWQLADERQLQAEVDGPPVKLRLLRPARLRGHVTMAGQPVADATVGVTWLHWRGPAGDLPPEDHPALGKTDASGAFDLGELAPGTVRMQARTATAETAQETTLAEGDAVEVQLKLTAPVAVAPVLAATDAVATGDLDGQVLTADGVPATHAIVVVSGPGVVQQLRVDGEGRFRVELPAEQRRSCTAVAVTQTDAPSESVGLASAQALVLRLRPGGRLSGLVRDRGGTGLAGARVFIDDARIDGPLPEPASAQVAVALTQADGTFELGPLRPGSYRLRAELDHKPPGLSAQVAVGSGERSRVEITLGDGATLKGRVTARDDGHPLVGAHVSVVEPGTTSTRTATAGPDGMFEIAGLAAGRHTLTAHVEGYGRESVSGIDVPAQGEIRRDIQLAKGQHLAFEGIGASLRRTPAGIEVGWLAENAPATAAGLLPGDVIRAVDGQPVDDAMPLAQVVERIRGEAGTGVTLEFERPGQARQTVVVTRRRVVADHGLPAP